MNFEQDILVPVTWVVLFVLTTVISLVFLVISQLIWILQNGWFLILLSIGFYCVYLQTHILNFF